jgi:hypothetical protein
VNLFNTAARVRASVLLVYLFAVAISVGNSAHAQSLPSSPIGTIPATVYWRAGHGTLLTQNTLFDDPQTACIRILEDNNNDVNSLVNYSNPRAQHSTTLGWGCMFDLRYRADGGTAYDQFYQWMGPQLFCPPDYSPPTNTSTGGIPAGVCQANAALSSSWFPQKGQCPVHDPVFPCRGVQVETERDIQPLISGLGFRRYYRSGLGYGTGQLSAPQEAFGLGWNHSYSGHLSFGNTTTGAVGAVFAHRADGTGAIFVPDASGAWISKPDTDDRLIALQDSWAITRPRMSTIHPTRCTGPIAASLTSSVSSTRT